MKINTRLGSKVLREVRRSEFSVAPNRRFVIELCRSDLDRFEDVAGAVPLEVIVDGVEFEYTFGFLRRSNGTLFEDSLLNSLVAEVIVGSIEYAFDRRSVKVEPKIA